MPDHVHAWKVTQYLLLGLPDREGLAERCLVFQCQTCGAEEGWQACWPLGRPIGAGEIWAQATTQERQASTPLTRMARAQQHYQRRF